MDLFLAKIHGHIAILGAALCLHPYFALRKARRPAWATRLAAYLASALVIGTNVLGWIIYPAYRDTVKLDLYRFSELVGVAFEVKEHLAWFACSLAVAGTALVYASTTRVGMRFTSEIRSIYGVMAVLMLVVCGLGIWVATTRSFDDMLELRQVVQ